MKRAVILGAGTAGTMMANKLAKALPEDTWKIVVVDRDDQHVYQPGLLFLPFGMYRRDDLIKRRTQLVDRRVELRLAEVDRVAPDESVIHFKRGDKLAYDILIIATGSRVLPEQTEGLTAEGWRDTAFDFYTLDGALGLAEKLADWPGGRLVVNVVEMPIKCPVAPLEFVFLAEAFFRKRGIRDKVELVYATPLEGAFTKPQASAALGDMLTKRGIEVVGDYSLARVDGGKRAMTSYDGRELGYDLLVTAPLHSGSEALARSQMTDAGGWFPTDKHTLQSPRFPNVFALGDATDLPTSKAGAVAHFQSEVLFENVLRFVDGKPPEPAFDGHANCFIETGDGKAMLIDFNYETEPLPGRYPLPGVGPFTLLGESEINHWGKLAFKWVYWNVLLAGKELPLDHRMLMAGKWS
ncbi:MAG: NAD(P)/FAD-dependent oxidoreductase [Myxococcales bacterium]|nr:NAD(P)/FAD-dependent oxidoreductase [Myxococcales bacterium]MBL0198251.1 NAD(P)/FAD-dependent oxidoreductase [Myxococcales bacterium]HQY62697.1 FAD/NAD(P)-binding oxidoreductase [Polyangiaceae bacterium]